MTQTNWDSDINNIYLFRLKQLNFGDALVCTNNSGWKIECIPDTGNEKLYVILKDGERVLQRKRIDSVLLQIERYEIPPTLQYTETASVLDRPVRNTSQPFIGHDRPLYVPVEPVEQYTFSDSTIRFLVSAHDNLLKNTTALYQSVYRIFIKIKDVAWTYKE